LVRVLGAAVPVLVRRRILKPAGSEVGSLDCLIVLL
jgi:hypothetical protein